MLYAFVSTDVDDSLPRRRPAREAHLARLHELNGDQKAAGE